LLEGSLLILKARLENKLRERFCQSHALEVLRMRVKKRCRYCPELFTPDPRRYRPTPDGKGRRSRQVACSKPECQRRRHRDACRRWHIDNPTYDEGRAAYLLQWRKNHPGYSKAYRKSHPAYKQSNREKQHERDRKRKNLAKQDVMTGFYDGKIRRLIDLAKRDASQIPPWRVSEEIRRYLARSYHLVNRDVIAIQEKIAQNRGHEEPTSP
jgi:hypothetical protein